jgi:hypothetical protein
MDFMRVAFRRVLRRVGSRRRRDDHALQLDPLRGNSRLRSRDPRLNPGLPSS